MRVCTLSGIALLLFGCTSGSSSPEPSASAQSPSTEAAPPSKAETSEEEEPSKAPIEQPPPLSKGPGAQALSLRPEPVEAGPEAMNAFSRSSNAFAIDLYGHLRKSQGEGNLAFSPASIEVALAMTWAGAEGETTTQMAKVLHLPEDREAVHGAAANLLNGWNDPERDTYELRVVNRLFGDKATTFEQPFLDVTRQFYAAELEQLDFRSGAEKSRAHINQWVEAQTNKRIQNLLPEGSINELTRLVLTNAVYFLGRWSKRFEEEGTEEQVFHAAGQEVQVKMMHQTQEFRFARLEGLKVLEMGYVGDELAMMVVLPDANDGLPELEGGLSLEELELWTGSLRERRIEVFLPRFRVEPAQSIRLKRELTAMGMPLPFQPRADFTKMSNPADLDERLYIDNVYHKAFVEVDEAGTEAAAATAVVMRARGGAAPAPSIPVFRADHPFLFFIRDLRTGTILFVGRVNNPSSPN